MAETTLVRARWIVTGAGDDDPILRDAALQIDNGKIVESGPFDDLQARHPDARTLGGPDVAIIPGLINSHHHANGAGVQQLGLLDDFLEPWILAHAVLRRRDVGLNTLLASAHLLRTGVTAVVDVHSGAGTADVYTARVRSALDAYSRSGIRVAFAAGTSRQSHLVHGGAGGDDAFLKTLPAALAARTRETFMPGPDNLDEDDYIGIIEDAWQRYRDNARVDVWFAPPGPQWVSDTFMQRIVERATALDTGVQTHLLESYYENLMGGHVYGQSALRHLHGLGMLSPRFSMAHGVWLDDADIEILAASGSPVVHCPGSNLRLRAGIAPLNALLKAGATACLGMDGTTLDDDDDMFAEMRLALRLQRGPAFSDPAPRPRDVFAMATINGAKLLGKEGRLGRLKPGYEADLVILDLKRMLAPWAAPECDPLDLIVLRARADDVRSVMIAGEMVYDDKRVLGFDEEAAQRELASRLAAEPYPADAARLVAELAPHIVAYYRAWKHPERRPHIAYNARG
ncbi:MAG: amidohydrolase family protein [Rhodospirillaceae bacterium]|nr:amidohydrolase family protein [Rhodospirillaceae bacterium]